MIIKINIIIIIIIIGSLRNHGEGGSENVFQTLSHLLGSFSNDDGDGKEDVKKAISLLRKTTTSHVHHAFCTFLYRSCTTTT